MFARSLALALAMLKATPVSLSVSGWARVALAAITLVNIDILAAKFFFARARALREAAAAAPVALESLAELFLLSVCHAAILPYSFLVARALASLTFRYFFIPFTSAEAAALFSSM